MGRSLWILDVGALQQITPKVIQSDAHLFNPPTVIRWRSEPFRGTIYGMGHKRFVGQDPPRGATLYYALGKKAKSVEMSILDVEARTVAKFKGKTETGLHSLNWTLSQRRGRRRVFTRPGTYRLVLKVDGKELTSTLRVEADPKLPRSFAAEELPVEEMQVEDEEERDKR